MRGCLLEEIQYFKYNSNTMGCLQLHYAPNDCTTTKDALFYVKSSKHLQPVYNTSLPRILCASTNDNKTQGAYSYTTHQTTTFLSRVHLLEVQSEV